MSLTVPYIGRFAPSPTGSLHFGSLLAAVASYCDAKANQGKWWLRIEDLDKPREQVGASAQILHQLEAFGFEWEGEVAYQSQRTHFYQAALDQLKQQGLAYPCTCSRKEIADISTQVGIEGAIYPQTCLHQSLKPHLTPAWRIKANAESIAFKDQIQGDIHHILSQEIGDFVLQRADAIFAYQLAVVVDDALQGITHVVRGADLLNSTTRQIYLQGCLNVPTPSYAHIPVACNLAGEKLSKQTLAPALDPTQSAQLLTQALQFLGQNPPTDLQRASLPELWSWAIAHWQCRLVPPKSTL